MRVWPNLLQTRECEERKVNKRGVRRKQVMTPSDDATSSPRKKRRAESKEDLSARESSRLRIDDTAGEPEEAKSRTIDDTDISSDLVTPDVLESRPLSPASLWRLWAQHSVASGGKSVRFVNNHVSVSFLRSLRVTDQVADRFPVCFNSDNLETLLTSSSTLLFGFFLSQVET
jgi:hypothetical protein